MQEEGQFMVMEREAVRYPRGGADYFHLKLTYEIGPRALNKLMHPPEESMVQVPAELQIVDVRDADSYAQGHIPGAINLPFEHPQAHDFMYHLGKMLPVIVYSYDDLCTVSDEAAYLLARNGYQVKTLLGGWDGWVRCKLPKQPMDEPLSEYEAVDEFVPESKR